MLTTEQKASDGSMKEVCTVYTQYVHHLGLISFVGLCLQKEQHEAILATNRLTTQQKAGESFS